VNEAVTPANEAVTQANAGVHCGRSALRIEWIPTFVGMTAVG